MGGGKLPAILRVSEQFEKDLLALEASAFREMALAYARIEQRLLREIEAFLYQVHERGTAWSIITQSRRYEELMTQVLEEIERYSALGGDVVSNAQLAAIGHALEESKELTRVALAERNKAMAAQLMTTWNEIPREALIAMVGFAGDGSPLVPRLREVFGQAADRVQEELRNGVALGWHPTKTVARLREVLPKSMLDRALLWARTEQLRAHREASRRSYEANPHIVKGWMRKAALDERTCAACIALDGTKYERDKDGGIPPMDDHPRGRCRMIPWTVGYGELLGIDVPGEQEAGWMTGEEWVKGMSSDDQRAWFEKHVGDGAYEAWRDGKISLRDVAKLNKNDKWGDFWTVKSVRELLGK